MSTLQITCRKNQKTIKQLFKELFLFQIQLQNYTDERFYFHEVAKELIQIIDQLLEILIDLHDSLEN